MIIRKLLKCDFIDYIKLIDSFRSIGINVTQKEFENLYDIIFTNSIIYVIEINKEIIGTAKLLIEQKFIHKLAKYGYIEDIFIKNEYRGKKFGQYIIKHIVDYCKENNFYKITLTCSNDLINFYKKNNFEVYNIHMSQLL